MNSQPGNWQTAGNEKIVALFRRALSQRRLSHAYLLLGPQHVGKMTLAMDLARAVNCESDNPPCGLCRSCQRIASGKHADIKVTSLSRPDPAAKGKKRTEIGIQEIKDLIEQASLPPFEGRMKVFVIDGAERMSSEAANALLKTLEEPPAHVLFILLSSREQSVLPTVLSRCQRIELRPLTIEAVAHLLGQRQGVDHERTALLARLSSGCPGWALSALSDDGEMQQRKQDLDIIVRIPSLAYGKRFALVTEWLKRFDESRDEGESLLNLWLGWWRDLLMLKAGCDSSLTNVDYRDELEQQSGLFDISDISASAGAIRRAKEQIGLNANLRLALESLMLNVPRKGRPSPAAAGTGELGR